jgi:MtN3 and saliva related transmembrane protein
MNIPTEYIGYAGALLTAINFLPQVIKVFKTKDAEDLSFWMLFLVLLAQSVWIIYAIRLNLIPVLISNASLFVMALILLVMKFIYKNKAGKAKLIKLSSRQ